MLDRSTHNLFDPDEPAGDPDTDIGDGRVRVTPRPAARQARPRRRPKIRPAATGTAGGVERRVRSLLARARPFARYLPVAVFMLILLARSGGNSIPAPSVTDTQSTASPALIRPSAQPRAKTVRSAVPGGPGRLRRSHTTRVTAASHTHGRAAHPVTTHDTRTSAAPVTQSTSALPVTVTQAPSPPPAQVAVAPARASGEEFTFER
jgi:predicted secreted protein